MSLMEIEVSLNDVMTIRAGLERLKDYYRRMRALPAEDERRGICEENLRRVTALSDRLIKEWDEHSERERRGESEQLFGG